MGQSKVPVQPRLVIHVWLKDANYFIMKLLEVKDGPTFTVKTNPSGGVDIWMSSRTYNDMKRVLKEAQQAGEF
jgi:hypothetical protein